MSEQDNPAPAVWDPTARGGAGGWVRRGEGAPSAQQPRQPAPPPPRPAEPPAAVASPGPSADEEPTELLPPVPEMDHPMVRPYAPTAATPTPPRPPQPAQPPTYPPSYPPTQPGVQPPAYPPSYPPTQPGAQPPAQPSAPQQPHAEHAPYAQQQGYAPHQPYAQQQGYAQQHQPYQSPYRQPQDQPGFESYGTSAGDGPASRSRMPLLVAGVVVGAAVLGVGAVWALGLGSSSGPKSQAAGAASSATPAGSSPAATGGSAAASPSGSASASAGGDARSQAQGVDGLLNESNSDRNQVVSAVQAVAACDSPASVAAAASSLQQAAADRQNLISKLGQLDISALPNGTALQQLLTKAENESLSADQGYASWAAAMSNGGCRPGKVTQTSDYQAAGASSAQATADKKAFVVQWDPIASQYGLHPWTENEL